MPLTDLKARQAKPGEKPRRMADGHGLFLLIQPNGKKFWRYRYRLEGRENTYAIGEYPQLSLSEARAARDRCRELVRQGKHPAQVRRLERLKQLGENANTFQAVAEEWLEKSKPRWRPYYLKQVERGLHNDVFPAIGALPIRQVGAAELLSILHKVEARGAETVAILIRQWCSAIFRYAVATLRADADPAAALKGAIIRPPVRNHPHLTRAEIPAFLEALDAYGGYATTTIAIRLLLYTFVRTVELRQAKWHEFDLEAAEWRIPAARMKMNDAHIVPLSRQALTQLEALAALTRTSKEAWLFPNYRRPTTCMTATTINRALERMGYGGRLSGHGFRSTASTLLNELGYDDDAIERQLAHAPRNKVRAIYNRAQYLPERRQMMQGWADFVDSLARDDAEKIVPLRQRAD